MSSDQQQQQDTLPSSEPSSFLVVGNVDDKTSFSSAIRSGHTAQRGALPITPGEIQMVLLSRSRFLNDLVSANDTNEDGFVEATDKSAIQNGEMLLLKDDELWKKLSQQCLLDIPRQDVFVDGEQLHNYADFSLKVSKLLEKAANQESNNTANPQDTVASVGAAAAANQQGWMGWGVNIALRTATLGLVGTSTFGGGKPAALPPALAATLKTDEGKSVAFRIAVACSQQGALAIILDGISAQFSDYEEQVNVGEVADTDVLPVQAPTRRSCVAVKVSSIGAPVVEVRKLLRIFRILPNGTAGTMFFVHTLLTIPLLPQGRHEVCLEWKVTLPPAVIEKIETKHANNNNNNNNNNVAETKSIEKKKESPVHAPEPVPLILAERLPEAAQTTTSRVLSDTEIARQLQLEFDEEEKRLKEAQLERDAELARSLKGNTAAVADQNQNNNNDEDEEDDEMGAVREISEDQERTLLEEALNNRRRRNNRRNKNRGGSRRISPRQDDGEDFPVGPPVAGGKKRACDCLGASSGFHRPNCPLMGN